MTPLACSDDILPASKALTAVKQQRGAATVNRLVAGWLRNHARDVWDEACGRYPAGVRNPRATDAYRIAHVTVRHPDVIVAALRHINPTPIDTTGT